MAKESSKQAASGNNDAQEAQPGLNILAQYIKDLSFENPHAPDTLVGSMAGQPELDISVNVNAKPMKDSDYEVSLEVQAKAQHKSKVVFNLEFVYGGVFRLQNIPDDSIQPLILIECPRLLFPFARQVIADTTRNGGFPPLMIDPIDFAMLYRQKLMEAGASQPN